LAGFRHGVVLALRRFLDRRKIFKDVILAQRLSAAYWQLLILA